MLNFNTNCILVIEQQATIIMAFSIWFLIQRVFFLTLIVVLRLMLLLPDTLMNRRLSICPGEIFQCHLSVDCESFEEIRAILIK